MSSKRKTTGAGDEAWSPEEDGCVKENVRKKPSKKKKKIKVTQKFKIHYSGFVTSDNRNERITGKTSTTLELDRDTSEEEIRNLLISELLQLRGKNFTFFTMDCQGNGYPCPCSQTCEAKDHSPTEWNASNIAVAANGNRTVYIKIEVDVWNLHESTSGYETTGLSENQGPLDLLEAEVYEAGSVVDFATNEVSSEPPLEIEKIVPPEGNVEGGYDFALFLRGSCTDEFKVQFGETDPIDVKTRGETVVEGKVPASSIVGVVEVKIVKTLRSIKNAIAFTYTDEKLEKKRGLTELAKDLDAAGVQELLMALAKRVGEMKLTSKEETTRFGDSGDGKTHTLALFRMIAATAARINVITFFEILFRTHVGCTLFRSFKDYQPPLEEIARENGHEELALLLEKKHLMFREDEDDSDDEVDWKAISKAIGEYQAIHDESVDKWSLQSTDSSEKVHGYLADRENSISLSSLQVSGDEICNEDTFEEEQAPLILQGREEVEIFLAQGEINNEKREDEKTSALSSPLHLLCEDHQAMPLLQYSAESGDCHTNGKDSTEGNPGSAKSFPVAVIKGCFHDTVEGKQATTDFQCRDKSQVCEFNDESSTEKKGREESYTEKAFVLERSEDHLKTEDIEMGEDHKSLGEKIKIIVRSYPEPVLFPFDDAVGRHGTTFSHNEVESLRKKLTSCPTKYLGDNEACRRSLKVDDPERHLKIMRLHENFLEAEVKLGRQKKSPPPLISERPHRHVKKACAVDITDLPSTHPRLELEESALCVSVNDPWTEPDFTDHSTPVNNSAAKGNQSKGRSCYLFSAKRIFLFSALFLFAVVLGVIVALLGKEERAFPTPEVFTIEANSSCNPEQVIWTNAVGKAGFKCLDCPSCPPGSEPSVPCGTKIENWTDISCVACQPGKTYSNKNDTAHCKPCTVCSTGRAILKNCTLKSNSQCSRCKEGFYYELLSFSCRPCSECCGDEKDFVASECSRYKHKCKVRSTPCSEKIRSIKSTPRLKKATPLSSIASTDHPLNSVVMNEKKKPTRAFETDVPTDKSNFVIIALAAVAVGLTRIFFSIVIKECGRLRYKRNFSGDVESRNGDESSPQSKALCESNQPDSQSSGSISPFLNRVFIQASVSMTPPHICDESPGKSLPPLPQSQDSASSQPYRSNPPAHDEYTANPDELTLVELEENHLDVFDWMCEELDTMQRDRGDFEKLAFRYKIPSATWKSFKNAFQRNGSPSQALMAHLKALHPGLPLHHVIKNLELIGRNDIVHRLKPYLKKNVDRSSA